MAMDFLSAGRAGQIAEILQKEAIMPATSTTWSEVTAEADERIVKIATTWALLMQHVMRDKPCELSVAAKITVGEALQYWNVRGKDVSFVMSRVAPLLEQGWAYSALLKAWLETPEGQRLGR
jgi:hypothetical protein